VEFGLVPIVEDNRSTQISSPAPGAAYEQQQRRRMLIALGVLLVALIMVLIKDRQFWIPSSTASESETTEPSTPVATNPTTVPQAAAPILTQKSPEPASASKRPKSKHPPTPAAHAKSAPEETADAPTITATNRAVLPPLEVEVVAGNQHRTIASANNPVSVELQPIVPATPGQVTSSAQGPDSTLLAPNAAAKVELSPGTAQIVSRPVDPSYPLLAKQMKVQGAVVLQALISKTGSIQDIQVLSGPAILSAAAREAVQQWRFKPYYQAGRPVETEARITVNFTISTY
jgi:protein TonB